MQSRQVFRAVEWNALTALVCFAAGEVSLRGAAMLGSNATVWALSGVALALLVLRGHSVWPGVFIGTLALQVAATGSIPAAFISAAGQTLEGVAAAYLLNRFVGGWRSFDRAADVFKFAALVGMAPAAIGAAAAALALGSPSTDLFFTSWGGHALGVLAVTPALILWANDRTLRFPRARAPEAALLLLCAALFAVAVFARALPPRPPTFYLAFLCTPLMLWAAFRFGRREVATGAVLLAALTVYGLLPQFGPFSRRSATELIFITRWYLAMISVVSLAVAAELSDRTRTEAAHALLASIVESSDDAIIGRALDDTIVSWNAGAQRLYGYTAGEALGRSITMLVPPGRDDELPAMAERLRSGENIPPYETRRVRKDGVEIDVSLAVSPVKNQSGKIIGASAIARDITGHKRAEQARAFLASVVESASDAILGLDLDGTIISWNRGAERTYGYSAAEAVGRSVAMLIPPERRDETRAARERLLRGERIDGLETERITKDGRRIFVSTSVSPIRNAAGEIAGVAAITHDITSRQLAEQQALESLREKETLLREIHHRVKNNLQIISSLLNLQAPHLRDEFDRHLIRESQGRVRSMALLHNMLYQSSSLASLDLAEYLRALVPHILRSHSLDYKPPQLQLDVQPVRVNIDTAVPCALIANELISNAVQHAFPNGVSGEIRVELHANSSGGCILRISDNGVGLPPDVDPKNTKSLGLQLVTMLADQLGASLDIRGDPGATFELTFSEVKYKPRG